LTFGLLGYAYASTGQFVSAESAYRSAVLLQPDVLDWKLGLTQSVLKQQKYPEAVTLCEELIARFPDRTDFWMLQANAYIGMGQSMKAAENYEIVRRMGRATPQSLNLLGDIYVNEGLWDLASDAYADALAADAAGSIERPLRSVEILAQRGALTQAKRLLAAIRERAGPSLDPAERARALKLESRIAVAEGQGGSAIGVLEEIVALDPLDGEALILLGQHYASAGDVDRAMFYYERAGGLEAFEAEAKVRHAQILVGQSRYSEAVPLLERAQELRPREEVARYLEQVERAARARS
jgi:tetratricopeptide (TPR) repeat protein